MLQTGTLAKIEQIQEDLKERLFGAAGNPGIIQHFGLQLADHSKTLGYVERCRCDPHPPVVWSDCRHRRID